MILTHPETGKLLFKPQPGPQERLFWRTEKEILFGGARGGGKALCNEQLVITPSGVKRVGDVRVGDLLLAVDGSFTRVIAIYPQPIKMLYRVEFAGGRDAVCCGEHLWPSPEFEAYTTEDAIRMISDGHRPSVVGFMGSSPVEIERIVEVGLGESTCFTVDHPSHTFTLANEIVTHNSYASIAWLMWGNQAFRYEKGLPIDPDPLSVDYSYVNHPEYRAQVIRKNLEDMKTWIRKARPIYEAFGAKYIRFPAPIFRFPSGAEFFISHMADPGAWEKYAGQEVHRIVWEEVTQQPSEEVYLLAMTACLRSPDPQLNPQILLTTNPIGPGVGWVKKRFVSPRDESGRVVPPETPIKDERSKHTRVYLPSRLKDNPALLRDGDYMETLNLLPRKIRQAMIEGDWNILEGQYFEEFRANGNLTGEPPWANHVIDPVPLMPWWARWIGGDWGYQHEFAFYWFCKNQHDRRIHVYREFVDKKMTPFTVGAEIAKRSLEELAKSDSKTMPLFMGRDTFADRDGGESYADGIKAGIESVLGDRGCIIREVNATDRDYSKDLREQLTLKPGSKGRIVIMKAFQNKEHGFMHIHEMLRWEEVKKVDANAYDPRVARQLQQEDPTGKKFQEYWMAYNNPEKEVLPKLQIWRKQCPRLIEKFPEAVHDPKRPEIPLKTDHDNELDAIRYGLYSHHQADRDMPLQEFVRQRMDTLRERGPIDPTDYHLMLRSIEEEYDKKKKVLEPFDFERIAVPGGEW